jgi:hypothetical protein
MLNKKGGKKEKEICWSFASSSYLRDDGSMYLCEIIVWNDAKGGLKSITHPPQDM